MKVLLNGSRREKGLHLYGSVLVPKSWKPRYRHGNHLHRSECSERQTGRSGEGRGSQNERGRWPGGRVPGVLCLSHRVRSRCSWIGSLAWLGADLRHKPAAAILLLPGGALSTTLDVLNKYPDVQRNARCFQQLLEHGPATRRKKCCRTKKGQDHGNPGQEHEAWLLKSIEAYRKAGWKNRPNR